MENVLIVEVRLNKKMNKILDFIKRHKILFMFWMIVVLETIIRDIKYPRYMIHSIIYSTIFFVILARVFDNKKYFKRYVNCPYCNKKIYEDANICENCGYVIKEEDNLKNKKEARKGNISFALGKTFFIGTLGMIFFITLFAIFIQYLFLGKASLEFSFLASIGLMIESGWIFFILIAIILIIIGVILKKMKK